MTDDAEMFDSFSVCESWAEGYRALHDADCEVWIGLRVPVVFLEAASEDGATAWIDVNDQRSR